MPNRAATGCVSGKKETMKSLRLSPNFQGRSSHHSALWACPDHSAAVFGALDGIGDGSAESAVASVSVEQYGGDSAGGVGEVLDFFG